MLNMLWRCDPSIWLRVANSRLSLSLLQVLLLYILRIHPNIDTIPACFRFVWVYVVYVRPRLVAR